MIQEVEQKLRVLVVAYYFPPMGGSGVQRITKFCKYLREFGWEPVVLTAEPQGYYAYDDSLMEEMNAHQIEVHRVASRDVNRFFKKEKTVEMPREEVRKKWAWLSHWALVPDSKIGWKTPAVEKGLELLNAQSFDMILATAPPFTCLLIGAELSKQTGIPLVADFREAWMDNARLQFPTKSHRKKHLDMEAEVMHQAMRVVTINRGIKEGLLQRHTGADGYNTIQIIPHGFDPEDFPVRSRFMDGKMRILYSGMFYDAQKPDTFLHALQDFLSRRPDAKNHVEAQFVGLTPHGGEALVKQLNLIPFVRFEGYLPHTETVRRMIQADVLWVTIGKQAHAEKLSTSKMYEYFGAQKPILGLLPEGDDAAVLRAYGASHVAEPDDIVGTSRALETFYDQWRKSSLPKPDPSFVDRFNRRNLTRELAKMMTSSLINLSR